MSDLQFLDACLDDELSALAAAGRLRQLKVVRKERAGNVCLDGRELVDFSSNDYLGLSRHPALIDRALAWTERWGAGAGASRLVSGTLELHARIEDKLAAFKEAEAALIFNSGFQANSSVPPTLFDKRLLKTNPIVFADHLNHASLHQGCLAAGVRQIRYRHGDLNHLEALLAKNADRRGARFIVSETVFSMDGDRADLDGLEALADRFGALLYLDDAHATGVLGPHGRGLATGRGDGVAVVMGTFGKALGSFGAYVACSAKLKSYLVNRSAGFVYSTALPPGVLGAIDAALDLMPELDAERRRLAQAGERIRGCVRAAGLDPLASSTQIVPAVIGGELETVAASGVLEAAGILGVAIRPPTVPRGTSRIRLAASAVHSDAELDLLADALLTAAGLGG